MGSSGSASSKKNKDQERTSQLNVELKDKKLLVVDVVPSFATNVFFKDLDKELKNITLIQVDEDALNTEENRTKPVLLICNKSSRIMSDLKRIRNLPRHDGTLILLVIHCVRADLLPEISLSFHLKDELPTVSEIIEMGYDVDARFPQKRIYDCSKKTEAINAIKDISTALSSRERILNSNEVIHKPEDRMSLVPSSMFRASPDYTTQYRYNRYKDCTLL